MQYTELLSCSQLRGVGEEAKLCWVESLLIQSTVASGTVDAASARRRIVEAPFSAASPYSYTWMAVSRHQALTYLRVESETQTKRMREKAVPVKNKHLHLAGTESLLKSVRPTVSTGKNSVSGDFCSWFHPSRTYCDNCINPKHHIRIDRIRIIWFVGALI